MNANESGIQKEKLKSGRDKFSIRYDNTSIIKTAMITEKYYYKEFSRVSCDANIFLLKKGQRIVSHILSRVSLKSRCHGALTHTYKTNFSVK